MEAFRARTAWATASALRQAPASDLPIAMRLPCKISGAPAWVRRPPPLLDEHTDEILREELGL